MVLGLVGEALNFSRGGLASSEDQSMVSLNFQEELLELLSHPSIVSPGGVPPGTSEIDIQTFERLHGLQLPPTLREWFSLVNGAFCGTQSFLGLNDYRVGSKNFRARSWLPVADDGCGDYFLIDLARPDQGDYPVFFWDHETDRDVGNGALIKGYAVASNVWIFSLLFLKHELARVGHLPGNCRTLALALRSGSRASTRPESSQRQERAASVEARWYSSVTISLRTSEPDGTRPTTFT
jgi:hypothetical protein